MGILDNLVKDPIALGLVSGAMESFVVGRTEQKRQAQEAAKAKKLKLESNQKTLVDTVLGSTDLSEKFLTNSFFNDKRSHLYHNNKDLYNAIAIKSLGAKEVTPFNKEILSNAAGNSTWSANFITNNESYLKENPSVLRILRANAATQTLSEGQKRYYETAKTSGEAATLRDSLFPVMSTKETFEGPLSVTIDGGRPVDTESGKELAKGDLVLARGGNPTKNALFWALDNKANQQDEIETLSDSNITLMSTSIEKSKNPAATAKAFSDNLNNSDTKAKFFLQAFTTMYASSEGANLKVGDILAKAMDITTEKIKSEKPRGIFAKTVLDYDEVKKITPAKLQEMLSSGDEDKIATANNFNALKALKQGLEDTDKGQGKAGVTYAGVDLYNEPISSLDTVVKLNSFLNRLDKGVFTYKNEDLDIVGFLNKIPSKDRANLISDINGALKNHDTKVTTTKPNVAPEASDDYSVRFPNLYKVDSIRNYITSENLNQPPANSTNFNQNINRSQKIDSIETNASLPPNQVRMFSSGNFSTDIHTLSPEFINFAKQRGFENARDILKDDGYFDLYTLGSGSEQNGVVSGNDNLFKVSNAIIRQVPNISKFNLLGKKQIATVTRAILTQGIDDDNEIFQILASLQDGEYNIDRRPAKMGLTRVETDRVLETLTKGQLDRKGIQERGEQLTSYITVLDSAINQINIQGNKSQLGIFINSLAEDLLTAETSVIKGTARFTLSQFGVDVFEEGSGAGTINEMNDFMDSKGNYKGFTDARFADAKFKSDIIVIAYNRAKSLDPNGRISDRDFRAAMDSVTSNILSSNQISKALLMEFKRDAEAQEKIVVNIASVLESTDSSNRRTVLKSNIRTLRAIPLFKKVSQMRSSIDLVRKYKDSYESDRSAFNAKYTRDIIRSHDPANSADQVYLAKRNNNMKDDIAVDIPVYVDSTGKILTSKELQERGFRI